MTLPFERAGAIKWVKDFLMDLIDPKKTPRVPREIRRRAARLLRHYPSDFDMDQAKKQAPEIFGDWK